MDALLLLFVVVVVVVIVVVVVLLLLLLPNLWVVLVHRVYVDANDNPTDGAYTRAIEYLVVSSALKARASSSLRKAGVFYRASISTTVLHLLKTPMSSPNSCTRSFSSDGVIMVSAPWIPSQKKTGGQTN